MVTTPGYYFFLKKLTPKFPAANLPLIRYSSGLLATMTNTHALRNMKVRDSSVLCLILSLGTACQSSNLKKVIIVMVKLIKENKRYLN